MGYNTQQTIGALADIGYTKPEDSQYSDDVWLQLSFEAMIGPQQNELVPGFEDLTFGEFGGHFTDKDSPGYWNGFKEYDPGVFQATVVRPMFDLTNTVTSRAPELLFSGVQSIYDNVNTAVDGIEYAEDKLINSWYYPLVADETDNRITKDDLWRETYYQPLKAKGHEWAMFMEANYDDPESAHATLATTFGWGGYAGMLEYKID